MEQIGKKSFLIFIVAYNAETTIKNVLSRIPLSILNSPTLFTEILIIDDASKDETYYQAKNFQDLPCKTTILKNPVNLGYGGNQKLGYRYALDNNFDYVALLHGDGQYAPEALPELLQPLLEKKADAVFGSRMLARGSALKGGMPLYKFLGNKILTFIQNRLTSSNLSEYHSGYRLYSSEVLSRIPFELNSDDFDFDTDIILQLFASKSRITELPIPTFYGNEICYVNGLKYATKILISTALLSLQRKGIFYQRKFDIKNNEPTYLPKFDFSSSHQSVLKSIKTEDKILIINGGSFELVEPYLNQSAHITVYDQAIDNKIKFKSDNFIQGSIDEIETKLSSLEICFNKVLLADVIEHWQNPEEILKKIKNLNCCAKSDFVISSPNVTFFPLRIMFLLGRFNYNKRGILDLTHCRLFTFYSLKKMLAEQGFQIKEISGIPAPFTLAFGSNQFSRLLTKLNSSLIKLSQGIFSYQIFIIATPKPSVKLLLNEAIVYSEELDKKIKIPLA